MYIIKLKIITFCLLISHHTGWHMSGNTTIRSNITFPVKGLVLNLVVSAGKCIRQNWLPNHILALSAFGSYLISIWSSSHSTPR